MISNPNKKDPLSLKQNYEEEYTHPDQIYNDSAVRYSSNHSKSSFNQETQVLTIPDYLNIFDDFKVAAEGHAQNLQNTVLSIKHKTDQMIENLSMYDDIGAAFPDKDTRGSSKYSRSRYNPLRGRDNALDDRLERYKKNAEDRKSQNRTPTRLTDCQDKKQTE
jgi:hypothetical protein